MSIIEKLETKLETKEINNEHKFEFIPKIHIHEDLSRWFCESFHALNNENSTQLYHLADALRKGIWDVIQEVSPEIQINSDDDHINKILKEIIKILKFRVVSYERITRRVVNYTRTMIEKARKLAKSILKQQDKLSTHIQAQSVQLKQEKINNLPINIETEIIVQQPSFNGTFAIHTQEDSKSKTLGVLKKKSIEMYKQINKLNKDKIQAVLNHDSVKLKNIEKQLKVLKTYTRAMVGARQHILSLMDDTMLSKNMENTQSVNDMLIRMQNHMKNTVPMDYELYKHEIQNQIDEHSSGLALYLGLKTHEELMQLKHDLVNEVCANVKKIFEEGQHEIVILNEEFKSLYNILRSKCSNNVLNYIEQKSLYYRAMIAKIQLSLLSLFDKR